MSNGTEKIGLAMQDLDRLATFKRRTIDSEAIWICEQLERHSFLALPVSAIKCHFFGVTFFMPYGSGFSPGHSCSASGGALRKWLINSSESGYRSGV
jgi:hypothetical protein